jgi:hypothetical protein
MPVQALFGLSVLTSFVAFGIVAKLYIAPRLKVMPLKDALRCLIAPHMFRFVGLSFLVPGVVSPSLSTSFATPAAYGDQIAALLAIIATIALTVRAAWADNLWGAGDLLYAFYQGLIGVGIDPATLRAAFYIPTELVAAFQGVCVGRSTRPAHLGSRLNIQSSHMGV